MSLTHQYIHNGNKRKIRKDQQKKEISSKKTNLMKNIALPVSAAQQTLSKTRKSLFRYVIIKIAKDKHKKESLKAAKI